LNGLLILPDKRPSTGVTPLLPPLDNLLHIPRKVWGESSIF
jgi:hypothetical protein